MKRLIIIAIAALSLCSCSILANMNPVYLADAAGKAMTGMTLTDAQIIELCQKSVAHLDAENKVDNGAYQKRLTKILNGVDHVGDLKLNFKVYITDQINAFACGDGSIRVYSGLMDVMDDDMIMAIIGHEIGHVVHKDTKKQMQRAYMTTAAREAVYAAGGVIGNLAGSVVGSLAESYVDAQFSQKQEFAADDYGFQFAIDHGYGPYSMARGLEKLVQLSNGQKASAVAQMFSSHPDSQERAARMNQKAATYSKK